MRNYLLDDETDVRELYSIQGDGESADLVLAAFREACKVYDFGSPVDGEAEEECGFQIALESGVEVFFTVINGEKTTLILCRTEEQQSQIVSMIGVEGQAAA